jgi:RNA polymerase sigma factor (sigma-70 family)
MGTQLVPLRASDLLDRAIVEHYDELRAAMRRRGHSPGVATEIVHDLYLRLASRPDAVVGTPLLKALLVRAAANLGIDRRRREQFEQRLFSGGEREASQVAESGPAPGAAFDAQRRLAALRRAIGELPARRREIFVMHRLGNLGAEEIAARLGISRNMVERHLRRALVHCLARLSELD